MELVKKLTEINKQFSEGKIINNSIYWVEDRINNYKMPFLTQISYVLRALLCNHIYLDGNKRTSLYITLKWLRELKLDIDEDKLFDVITKIAKNNINEIRKIKRMLKKCYKI